VAESPGATDDGSGVAVLLETARALSASQPLLNSVIFLFTDDEESGTLGAQAFIAHHPWAQNVNVVIGFDAGGLSGPGILSATSADNGWLIRQLSIADTTLTGSSAINALADSGTDFGHAFKPAGFSGFAFDLYWDRRIHTPEDKLENVNLSSLQHQGSHALLLARHFGNLDQLADPKEPDAVYFSVLRSFSVAYPSTWAAYLAVAVALLFSVLLAFGLRCRILTWRGMGYGMLVLLVGLMFAPLPALLLGGWITGMPIRYAARSLDQPREVAAVVFLALALILLWFYWARRIRIASLPDLTVGALLPLMIGMLGISFAIPALSFALVWPGLLSLLACASWFYIYRHQKFSKIVIFISICSGAASIIILGPTILLGLFDQPTLTLLLFGALCGFLFPQIAILLGGTEKFLPADRSHPGTAAGQ
jgi:hypothetical protein